MTVSIFTLKIKNLSKSLESQRWSEYNI